MGLLRRLLEAALDQAPQSPTRQTEAAYLPLPAAQPALPHPYAERQQGYYLPPPTVAYEPPQYLMPQPYVPRAQPQQPREIYAPMPPPDFSHGWQPPAPAHPYPGRRKIIVIEETRRKGR